MKQAKPISVKSRKKAKKDDEATIVTSWTRRRKRGVRPKKPFNWKQFFGQFWHYTKFTFITLALILCVSSPYTIWLYLSTNNIFQIQKVQIHSNEKYLVGQRKDNIINELIGRNFVSYNLDDYRQALLNNPWVKNAEVSRRWPDEIDIMIEERRPIAIWNDLYLIESDGAIFEPDLMPSDIVISLQGNVEQKEKVLAGMRTAQATIQTVGLNVEKIILDYRGAWIIVLENDVELYLGSMFFEERLQRFVMHYPSSIQSKMDNIVAIDFRYDHGYALKWKR